MNRRIFLSSVAAATCSSQLAATTATSTTFTSNPTPMQSTTVKVTAANLAATAQVQASHPRIIELAGQITQPARNERESAVLIHDWVRDQIAFGIPRSFYESTAVDVLDAKVGYCNTKVSLFNALLRAKGVPTRIRMMDLSAQVLSGLFSPGTAYVDHAITEVFFDDQWLKVDSYVVDTALANAARKRLAAQLRSVTATKVGFGIHLDGSSTWDGRSNSLIQCVWADQPTNYILKDHGVFDDVNDFYRQTDAARNRLTVSSRAAVWLGALFINRQIASIRAS